MDLILWRHADAEPGSPDIARRLTPKGVKQAQDVARWLQSRLTQTPRILVSPAQRTLQTAGALSEAYEIMPELAPGASAASILAAAGWPHGRQTILVGHQPSLGEVASLLIAGVPLPWSIKKGAVWWISQRTRDGEQQIVLRAVVAPEFT